MRDHAQRAVSARSRTAPCGNPGRRRPPGVHDAQRPHRRRRRDHRLLASDPATTGRRASTCGTASPGQQAVAGSRRREEGQGPGDDDARRVLQGRARALELAHDRPDAHHLRLLPALHEAAGRPARQGDRHCKVHLFGSLSATGKGHGTERAALAGVIGKEPATVDPEFLDSLAAKPDQTFPVKLGDKTFNVSLKDIIYDAPKGDFPHPNTMTCKLMAGDDGALRAGVLLGRRRVHRVEGLSAAEEGRSRSTRTRR